MGIRQHGKIPNAKICQCSKPGGECAGALATIVVEVDDGENGEHCKK